MHGIQHLFRQHALEKQTSTESWHSAQSAVNNQAHLQQHYGPNHAHSVGENPATATEDDGPFDQGENEWERNEQNPFYNV